LAPKAFLELIENFLDGPGNIKNNRESNLGRLTEINHKNIIAIVLFISIILSLLFYIFPQIDIEFSKLFLVSKQTFIMTHSFMGYFYHKIIIKILQYICILIPILYILGEIIKRPILTLTRRRFLFILLSIAITAGLMTNFLLKDNFGRARPRDVIQFGGTKIFTPALVVSNQCRNNCSFVSGEASFAFSFICLALIARRRRKLWICGTLIFAGSVALMRIAMGAHFLSDSVLAGIYTILVILFLERLLLVNK